MEALREIVMFEEGSHLHANRIPPADLTEWPQQAFISSFRKYTV
jgi:hypothetical protein